MLLQTPAAHLTLGDFVNNQLKFSDLFDFGVFYCDLQANGTTTIKSSNLEQFKMVNSFLLFSILLLAGALVVITV